MKYEKVIFSLVLDTIDNYYPTYTLKLFNQDKVQKEFKGYSWQFEIGERIEVYTDEPVGQDFPRRKGELMFSIEKSNVEEFCIKSHSNEEISFVRELNELYSDYLWRKLDNDAYTLKKQEILLKYNISIDMSKFEI